MCSQNMSDLNSSEIAGSPPGSAPGCYEEDLYVDCRRLEETGNQNLGRVFSSAPFLLGSPVF